MSGPASLHAGAVRCPVCAGGRIKSIGACSVCGLDSLHLRDDGELICSSCGFDTRQNFSIVRDFVCPNCGRSSLSAACGCRVCLYCDFADRCSRPRTAQKPRVTCPSVSVSRAMRVT